jgi:mannosyltransferase OCH1-like enzyme
VPIPPILHQIWLGPDPFPAEYTGFRQTWIDRHPGWELRFWSEDDLPADLRRPEAAERLRVPAERADILRIEVLWRFGGVYVDVDFECLRSIEPLLEGVDFFVSVAKPGRLNNALMGSVAGHPLLDRALDELRPREFHGYDKSAAGPLFLDRLLEDQSELTRFPPEVFYPRTPEEQRTAYAVHHEARSWKDEALLREDIRRAEERMAGALEKLAVAREREKKWRARCKAAEAELDRLHRSWAQRLRRRIGGLLRR